MILQKQKQDSNNSQEVIRVQIPYLEIWQFRGKNKTFILPFLFKLHFEITKTSLFTKENVLFRRILLLITSGERMIDLQKSSLCNLYKITDASNHH